MIMCLKGKTRSFVNHYETSVSLQQCKGLWVFNHFSFVWSHTRSIAEKLTKGHEEKKMAVPRTLLQHTTQTEWSKEMIIIMIIIITMTIYCFRGWIRRRTQYPSSEWLRRLPPVTLWWNTPKNNNRKKTLTQRNWGRAGRSGTPLEPGMANIRG